MIEIKIHRIRLAFREIEHKICDVPGHGYKTAMIEERRYIYPDDCELNGWCRFWNTDLINVDIYKDIEVSVHISVRADGKVYLSHRRIGEDIPIGEWRLLKRGEN